MTTPLAAHAALTPHPGSHLQLLLPPPAFDGVGDVDAVVVPTARGADHVLDAARLAADLGAVLLVLCSLDSTADDVAAAMADVPGLAWFAVDVPKDHAHPLLPPPRHRPERGGRTSLSRKRNIALATARMVGWRTILFLDDDIRAVQADQVKLAAGELVGASAVGLAVENFPDNSVACHANRLGGGEQTVFVGGAALLVDVTDPDLGHFPTVYNEDWLFLFDALAAGRVRREGSVKQLPYDPFARPARARDEEFGDIVAEGLVAWLESGERTVPLSRRFWSGFLRRRAAFLARATVRVAADRPTPQRRAALRALAEATARCAAVRPSEIVAFLQEWRMDRTDWRDRLARVDPAPDVRTALRRLGLDRPLGHVPPADLAVVVPGFLDGPASPAHRALAEALRTSGLPTVVLAPRGMPQRPGEEFTHGPTRHLADLTDLLDQHAVPGGRVVLVGHCYGAWLAGLLAGRDERVTHLVALMPTRCFLWPEDYRDDRDRWRRRGERLLSFPEPGGTTLSAVRLPHDLVTDALRHDLPAALASMTIPALFVAGTKDEVVPAASVVALHAGYPPGTADLVTLDVGHDYRDVPSEVELVTDTVAGWVREHLDAAAVASIPGGSAGR